MFINFTNHSSGKWPTQQIECAHHYGEILDLPFPEVDPVGDTEYIEQLAQQFADRITDLEPSAVLCQGEMTLAFAVANVLMSRGITVLAACSERVVTEIVGADGERIKQSEFRFVGFREYVQVVKNC